MRHDLTSFLVSNSQRWQVNDSCKARNKESSGLKAQEGTNYVIIPSEAQYDFEDRRHFQISAP
jgi:hypothetical protein